MQSIEKINYIERVHASCFIFFCLLLQSISTNQYLFVDRRAFDRTWCNTTSAFYCGSRIGTNSIHTINLARTLSETKRKRTKKCQNQITSEKQTFRTSQILEELAQSPAYPNKQNNNKIYTPNDYNFIVFNYLYFVYQSCYSNYIYMFTCVMFLSVVVWMFYIPLYLINTPYWYI